MVVSGELTSKSCVRRRDNLRLKVTVLVSWLSEVLPTELLILNLQQHALWWPFTFEDGKFKNHKGLFHLDALRSLKGYVLIVTTQLPKGLQFWQCFRWHSYSYKKKPGDRHELSISLVQI